MYSEEVIINRILEDTLRYYYKDINIVTTICEFCNKLWDMDNMETRVIEEFQIIIQCHKSLDGYDNVITKYSIL